MKKLKYRKINELDLLFQEACLILQILDHAAWIPIPVLPSNMLLEQVIYLFKFWFHLKQNGGDNSTCLTELLWRRQWHPTPVLLPGKSHGWRSLVGCSPWGRWGSDTTEQLHFHFSLSCIGEVNGNPLQCSCLENPRDGGAWWAVIYGVAQSRTRLKRLSSSSSSNRIANWSKWVNTCDQLRTVSWPKVNVTCLLL